MFSVRFITSVCYVSGGSKGVINFPWTFYTMRSVVPVGHFRNISGHLFTWLVCGSFELLYGLLFTVVSCEMTRAKQLVLKLTLDPLRMMEYRVSKASTVSIITTFTHHQLSTDVFFSLLSMKYDIKIQKCSYLKVPEIKSYTLSQGHSVFRRKKYFFLSGGLSFEAIHQSSGSSFCDFFVKTTKES